MDNATVGPNNAILFISAVKVLNDSVFFLLFSLSSLAALSRYILADSPKNRAPEIKNIIKSTVKNSPLEDSDT